MKIVRSVFFRAISALVAGVMLCMYREETFRWVTIVMGIVFFVSGVVSCCIYLSMQHQAKEMLEKQGEGKGEAAANVTGKQGDNVVTIVRPSFTMPIVGVGSIILGALLAILPQSFAGWLMYIFAALLIIGALGQVVALIRSLKMGRLHWLFWIAPFVILGIGILTLLKPEMQNIVIIMGTAMLLYGVTEAINGLALARMRKDYAAMMAGGKTPDDGSEPIVIEES